MKQAKQETVLVIDDDPASLEILFEHLQQAGFRMLVAKTGTSALKRVKNFQPDIILLDIMLPDIDGFELCRRLKESSQQADTPIIFLSALTDTADKIKGLNLSAVDYITKPFQPAEVVTRVQKHLLLQSLRRRLEQKNTQLEQEIAERKRTENELRKYERIVSATTDLISLVDRNYIYQVVNEAYLVAHDKRYDEIVGHSARDLHGVDVFENIIKERFDRALAGETIHYQAWFDYAGLERKFMSVTYAPYIKVDNTISGVVVSVRDITEHQQLEAQKQRLATLEERERIGQELHDDLGQVMGYVNVQAQAVQELLAQNKSAPAQVALKQLLEAAQNAHTDVRRYILGIRADPYPPAGAAPADFRGTLEQYLGDIERHYGLQVRVSLPEEDTLDIPLAPEVSTQLLRIIQEALTNIRKHAGVDTARLFFFIDTQQVQAVIEDEGTGFESQELEARSQEADESLTPSPQPPTPNHHFGLQIMRERAEKIGGSLEVRSTPGEGTRVVARMPRTVSLPAGTEPGTGLRVLLVDDHPLFLEGLRTLLAARGLQVVGIAHDGLEAQEKARTLLPDVILMDVQMPRCDGVEATRRIKAELPEMQIVMLTMAADDETLFAALKAGASGYLLKNLKGDDFYHLLGNLAQGEVVLAPGLAAKVLTEFMRAETASPAPEQADASSTPPSPLSDPSAFPELTSDQVKILDLIAQGLTYKEVGAAVHLSERAIRYHMGQILERLHLKNRREAVTYARRKGLGEPE